MSEPISPYQMLGVLPTSSAKEIQSAYRRLARRFHPDLSDDPSAAATMARLNAAYEILRSAHHLAPIGQVGNFERADAAKRYRSTMPADPPKPGRRVDVRA
jgi:curved DNA-binding protein CbpA